MARIWCKERIQCSLLVTVFDYVLLCLLLAACLSWFGFIWHNWWRLLFFISPQILIYFVCLFPYDEFQRQRSKIDKSQFIWCCRRVCRESVSYFYCQKWFVRCHVHSVNAIWLCCKLQTSEHANILYIFHYIIRSTMWRWYGYSIAKPRVDRQGI